MCDARGPAGDVVIVDDDEALLASFKFMLEIEGFTVRAYRSGEATLRALAWSGIGCLIVDYHLTGMNGLDLVQALRDGGMCAPAVLITTQPSAQVRRRAADAGTPIIEKPLLGDGLAEQIRRIMRSVARCRSGSAS